MKEENEILQKVGKGNAFKVPEGYFEKLPSEIMAKLPEKEKVSFEVKKTTTWDRVKPLFYLAAMFVGAALIIRVASQSPRFSGKEDTAVAIETAVVIDGDSDEFMNSAIDASMMDDYSLYIYLTDADID